MSWSVITYLGGVKAFAAPFGVEVPEDSFREFNGELLAHPGWVARLLVSGGTERETKDADSGISGHKKTRRQRFYRNLDVLREEVGIGTE